MRRLRHALVELFAQGEKRRRETRDAVVRKKRKRAHSAECDVFLVLGPSERIVRVIWVGRGHEDDVGRVRVGFAWC
jgi:hypothetical protein